jgi:hypothetical protein
MRRFFILATSTLVSFSAVAQATELPYIKTQSGSDMVEACRIVADGATPPPDKEYRTGICFGEIEALTWLAPGVAGDEIRSCVPENVTEQQIAKVIADYLDKNRDMLHEPFEGLALQALSETWPCRKKSGWLARLWDTITPQN